MTRLPLSTRLRFSLEGLRTARAAGFPDGANISKHQLTPMTLSQIHEEAAKVLPSHRHIVYPLLYLPTPRALLYSFSLLYLLYSLYSLYSLYLLYPLYSLYSLYPKAELANPTGKGKGGGGG
eukprot:scaffold100598_cov69-Phaeocystis_antarctica.AAC.1